MILKKGFKRKLILLIAAIAMMIGVIYAGGRLKEAWADAEPSYTDPVNYITKTVLNGKLSANGSEGTYKLVEGADLSNLANGSIITGTNVTFALPGIDGDLVVTPTGTKEELEEETKYQYRAVKTTYVWSTASELSKDALIAKETSILKGGNTVGLYKIEEEALFTVSVSKAEGAVAPDEVEEAKTQTYANPVASKLCELTETVSPITELPKYPFYAKYSETDDGKDAKEELYSEPFETLTSSVEEGRFRYGQVQYALVSTTKDEDGKPVVTEISNEAYSKCSLKSLVTGSSVTDGDYIVGKRYVVHTSKADYIVQKSDEEGAEQYVQLVGANRDLTIDFDAAAVLSASDISGAVTLPEADQNRVINVSDLDPSTVFSFSYTADCDTKLTVSRGSEELGLANLKEGNKDWLVSTPEATVTNNGRTVKYYFVISGTTSYGDGRSIAKKSIRYVVNASFRKITPSIESIALKTAKDAEAAAVDGSEKILLDKESNKTDLIVKIAKNDQKWTENPVVRVFYKRGETEETAFVLTDPVESDGILTYKNVIESTPELGGSSVYYVRVTGRTDDFTASRKVATLVYDDAAPVLKDAAIRQNNTSDQIAAFKLDQKITANKTYTLVVPFSNVKNTNGTSGTALKRITLTPEHGGQLSAGYKTVVYEQDEIASLGGRILFDVSAQDALALRKTGAVSEKYTVEIEDLAGNKSSREFVVNFYEDDIQIETTVTADKETQNSFAESIFGARSFRVKYVITTDVKLRSNVELSVTKKEDGQTVVTDALAEDMKLVHKERPTEPDEDGKYTYVYEYTLKNLTTVRWEKASFNVTNVNGVKHHVGTDLSAVEDVETNVINIDVNKPKLAVEDANNADATMEELQSKWYQSLYLNIRYWDDAEGLPEKAVSGIDKIEVLNGSSTNMITGTGDKEVLENVEVVESKSIKGTPVSITVTDKAGNTTFERYYFHVDKTKPVTSLRIDGKSAASVNGKVLESDGSKDPEITFVVKDKLTLKDFSFKAVYTDLDGNVTEKTVKYEAMDCPEGSSEASVQYTKKLSEIFGTAKEGTYTVSLKPSDKAGNPAEPITSTFVLDNTAPKTDIQIKDEYKDSKTYLIQEDKLTYENPDTGLKYNYNKYYASAVRTLELIVTDVNPKTNGVTVYLTKNGGTKSAVKLDPEGWVLKKNAAGNVIGMTYALQIKNDGVYEVSIQAMDKSGMTSQLPEGNSQTVAFVIDTTDPVISISNYYKLNNGYSNKELSLIARVSDKNEDIQDLKITGTVLKPNADEAEELKEFKAVYTESVNEETGEVSKYYTSDTYSEDGYYELTFTAIDKAGNPSTKKIAFTVDNLAPVVDTLILNPMVTKKELNPVVKHYSNEESGKQYDYQYYFSEDVTIQLESRDYNNKDNGEGIFVYDVVDGVKTELKPDGEWTLKSGTTSTLMNYLTVSGEGKHRILIRSVDKSGHWSSSRYVDFVLDKTNPEITSIVSDPALTAETEATQYIDKAPGFELVVKDDFADTKDLQFKITRRNEDGSIENLGLKRAKYVEDIYSAAAAYFNVNGDYTVTFTAVDKAGNQSKAATFRFTVDKTNPLADIIIREADRKNTAKQGSKSSYKNSKTGVSYNYDKYFNQDITIDFNIMDYNIDKSLIKVTDVNAAGEEVALTVSEWTNGVKEINGKNVAMVTASATIPKTAEGTHKINLSAVDRSGRTVAAQTVTFTVDSTNPVITLNLNGTNAYTDMQKYLSQDASLAAAVADKNADTADLTMSYVLTEDGKDAANQAKTGKRKYENGKYETANFTVEGYYTVTFTAVDKAGNKSQSKVGFTVDKSVPITDIVMENPTSAAKFTAENRSYKNDESGRAYAYGKYFNKDVTLDFSVADYHNKDNAADIVITDSVNGSLPKNVTLAGAWQEGKADIANGKSVQLPALLNKATFTEEGVHTVTITSTDKSGNKATTQTVTFEIDKTAPVITLSLNGSEFTGHKYLMTDGVAGAVIQDKNKDVKDLLLVVKEIPSDKSAAKTTSQYTEEGNKTYGNDSRYAITYTAIDLAGNKTVKSMEFTVDKTKPIVDITVQNPMNAAKASANHNSYSNAEFNNAYDYAKYFNHDVTLVFKVRDYNSKEIIVTDNGEQILSLSDFTDAGNGVVTASATISSEADHEIVLSSVDMSGAEAAKQTVSFTIDKTAPSLSASLNGSGFSSGASETYLTTDGNVNISVFDTNKDTADLVRTAKITQPSASTQVAVANVSEGNDSFGTEADYSVEYVATDLAGNVSSTYVVNFRVDKTAPSLNIDGIALGSTTNKSVTINYNMVEAFYWDMNSATVSVYKKLDGRGEALLRTVNYSAGSSNSVNTEQFSDDGEYRFEFVAEDKAGNKANTSFTFILDGTAPVIALKNVKNYAQTDEPVTLGILVTEDFFVSNKVTLSGTYKDIDGKEHKVQFDDYDANGSRNSELSQVFSEDGIYDIEVKSVDRGKNEASQKLHFTIDQTDPVIGDLASYVQESTNKFTWDVNTDDLVTDLTVTDITLYIDGVEYDGVSKLEDGTHVLKVVAEDELGHKSEKEVSFLLDTKAPNIIITGVDNGAKVENPITVKISVQIDEDTLNWVTVNGEKKELTNGKSCTFTVDKAGNYVIEAEAVDNAGNTGTLSVGFTYGKKFIWWIPVAVGAGVLGIGGGIYIGGASKKKKKEEN